MHQIASTSFCLAVSNASPAQQVCFRDTSGGDWSGWILRASYWDMDLLQPSSGCGWAEVIPEGLILGAGTQQFILTQMMPLFSLRSKGATAKWGWGAKTQSQESHCLHRAQLLFLHTEQYGPGNKGGRKSSCRLNHEPGQWEVLSPRSWLGISLRTEAALATRISRWLPTSQGSESLGPERHAMPHSSPGPPLHSMALQKWLLPA